MSSDNNSESPTTAAALSPTTSTKKSFVWGWGVVGHAVAEKATPTASRQCYYPSLIESLSCASLGLSASCGKHLVAVAEASRLCVWSNEQHLDKATAADNKTAQETTTVSQKLQFQIQEEDFGLFRLLPESDQAPRDGFVTAASSRKYIYGIHKGDETQVYMWTVPDLMAVPEPMSMLEPVVQIACGSDFVAVVTRQGSVFSWGQTSHGRLGLKLSELPPVRIASPQRVKGFDGKPVATVACGWMHTVAVTAGEGNVYSWGCGLNGRLGHGCASREDIWQPTLIQGKIQTDCKITHVACGYHHTLCVDAYGILYSWGGNEMGQLGLGDSAPIVESVPTVVSRIPHSVEHVACGAFHSVVVCQNGNLYSWGWGKHGQLGHGDDTTNVAAPKLVESLVDLQVSSVSCGGNFTVAVTDRFLTVTNDYFETRVFSPISSVNRSQSIGSSANEDSVRDIIQKVAGSSSSAPVAVTPENRAVKSFSRELRGSPPLVKVAQDYRKGNSSNNKTTTTSSSNNKNGGKSQKALAQAIQRPNAKYTLDAVDAQKKSMEHSNVLDRVFGAFSIPVVDGDDDDSDLGGGIEQKQTSGGQSQQDDNEEKDKNKDSTTSFFNRIRAFGKKPAAKNLNNNSKKQGKSPTKRMSKSMLEREKVREATTLSLLRLNSPRAQLMPNPNIKNLDSSNLSLNFRPANLPPKSPREAAKHMEEVSRMNQLYRDKLLKEAKAKAALREKEQRRQKREAEAREKKHKHDLEKESKMDAAAQDWMNNVVPHWGEGSKYVCRARELVWKIGIPPRIRGKVWPMAIGNSLMITKELYTIFSQRAKNARKLKAGNAEQDAAHAEAQTQTLSIMIGREENLLGYIENDLDRTFPSLAFFQQDCSMNEQLRDVLETFCFYRPDIGYVQGMSYLAGNLLLYMDPYTAFVAFANLLNSPFFHVFLKLDPQSMKQRFSVFVDLFKTFLPKLYAHFVSEDITPDLYFMEWCMTIFCKRLALDVVGRVWDCFLVFGEAFVYRTAVGILKCLEPKLLEGGFELIMKSLQFDANALTERELFDAIAKIKLPHNLQKKLSAIVK